MRRRWHKPGLSECGGERGTLAPSTRLIAGHSCARRQVTGSVPASSRRALVGRSAAPRTCGRQERSRLARDDRHPFRSGHHGLQIAHRDRPDEFAAPGLLLDGLSRALAENRQLHLAHSSLHAKQQPVVWRARFIHTVLIDNERTNQSAELEQGVPITSVTCKTRGLNGQDGTDATLADGRQQLLEARSGDPAAGATKIVVNYLNVAPTELVPALDEAVLTPLALEIVYNLIGR